MLSTTPINGGDFDGDGRVDYAQFDLVSNNVSVRLGSDATSPLVLWGQLPTGSWTSFETGDFNGDGRDDLAARSTSQNGPLLFALSESARFNVVPSTVSVNWAWNDTLVGDFDGNGSQDLIGWNAGVNQWQFVCYDDRTGAKSPVNWGAAVHSLVTSNTKPQVGDANRDGRDDLVIRDPSDGNWWVGLSQGTGTGTFSPQNWGNWFTEYLDSEGKAKIDEPYQRIIDIFSDVYNNIETEFYPGVMKGPTATAETKGGNSWDQAALLVQQLDFAGFNSGSNSGIRRATKDETLQWLGAKDVDAALDILRRSVDGMAQYEETTDTFIFRHAWATVYAPTATGLTPESWAILDPSWKFCGFQAGITLNPNGGSGLLTSFDTFATQYLFTKNEDNKFVKDQLPIEAYEDQVMAHLATLQGKSLADVAYDGPIIQRLFKQIPASKYGGTLSQVSHGDIAYFLDDANSWADDFETYVNNPSRAADWTHRVKISINGADYTLSVPKFGLETIDIWYSSAGTGMVYPNLSIAGQLKMTAPAVATSGDVTIQIAHLDPSQFSGLVGGLSKIDTYQRKAGQTVVVSLDANQYSSGQIANKQAYVNSKMSNIATDDIPELLGYIGAKYWYNYNRDARTLAHLTQTIDIQSRVGSGLITSDTDFAIYPHLNFPLVPDGAGVDLKNWVLNPVAVSWAGNPGAARLDAVRMAAFNASALENDILEEVLNAESISTVKGIQLYLDSTASSSRKVVIIERGPSDGTGSYRVVARYNQSGNQELPIPEQKNAQGVRDLLVLDTTTETAILQALDRSGTNRIFVPLGKTSVTGTPGWSGAVYIAELFAAEQTELQYIIQQDDAPPSLGADRVGAVAPQNPALNLGSFPNQTFASDPVNVANGNMFRDEVDFRFPAGSLPLDFARHYDSQNPMDVGFGVGWVHSFTGILYSDPDESNKLTWLRGDGTRHTFTWNATRNDYDVPASLFGVFKTTGGSTPTKYEFFDKDGTQYVFTAVTPFGADGIANDISSAPDYNVQVKGRLTEINYRGADSDKIAIQYVTGTVRVSQAYDAQRLGRWLQFSYGSGNNPVTVTKHESGQTPRTWTYFFHSTFSTNTALPGYTNRRLIKVSSPTDQFVALPVETVYEYYEDGPNARLGLIKQIFEPNQVDTHQYEYYSNGRVFRVTDGMNRTESFNYNQFRNLTEFTDERGNVETYIHQDNGLLKRQIHPDRSRLEYTWGGENTHEEFLMRGTVDELGQKEIFWYYQPNEPDYRRAGELKQSYDKDGVETRYEYWVSQNPIYQYISELSKNTVAPGANQLVTEFTRDDRGFVKKVKDAEGNVTENTYFDYSPSTPVHLRGRLKTQTQPKGVSGNEAVDWQPLAQKFVVTGNTLTVRLLTGNDPNRQVSADAIRIDRLDADGVLTRIIDNHTSLATVDPNFRFSPVGDATTYWESTVVGPEEYDSDALILRGHPTVQGSATWIFRDLLPGIYRISATWTEYAGHGEDDAVYQVFDGLPDSTPDYSPATVDQQLAPSGFRSYQTVFEYDMASNVVKATSEGLPAGRRSYDSHGNVVYQEDPTGVATVNQYDVLGRLRKSFVADPKIVKFDNVLHHAGSTSPSVWDTQSNGDTLYLHGNTRKAVAINYQITANTVLEFDFEAPVAGDWYGISIGNLLGNQYVGYETVSFKLAGAVTSPQGWNTDFYNYVVGSGKTRYRIELGQTSSPVPTGTYAYLMFTNIALGGGSGAGQSYYSNIRMYESAGVGAVATTTFSYDPSGRLTSTTDALGRVTAYSYDNNGKLVATNYADQTTTSHWYDEAGNCISTVDESGQVTRYVYDSRNRLIQTIFPDGSFTRIRYDGADRVIASADELNQITYFAYDRSGRLTSSQEWLHKPEGWEAIQEYNEYDAFGWLKRHIDAKGNRTDYQYDKLGRVVNVRTSAPSGGTPLSLASTRYDANGNVEQRVAYDATSLGASIPAGDPSPLIQSHSSWVQVVATRYDAFGQPVETTNADNTKTSTIYDAAGRVRYTFDELGRKSELSYDDYGRLEHSIAPEPDGAGGAESPQIRYVRDAFGNVKEEWEYFGEYQGQSNVEHKNTYTYDKRNRLIKTLEKDNDHRTEVQFDKAGRVIATVNALGNASYLRYDKRGRVIEERQADPDGGGSQLVPVTRHKYDLAGNRKSTTDPLGNVTTFEYDTLNRLRKQSHTESVIADDSNVADDAEFTATAGSPTYPTTATFGQDITILAVSTTAPAAQEATWTFSNLAEGKYRISLSAATAASSPETTIEILTASGMPIVPATTRAAQLSTSDFKTVHGETEFGWHWVRGTSGVYEISVSEGGTVRVRLSLSAAHPGKAIVADAVRLDRTVSNSYDYDANGNLTRETNARGFFTEYIYDALNRRTSVSVDPDRRKDPVTGSVLNGAQPALVTTSLYDGYGNLVLTVENRGTTATTADDRINHYEYDKRNRLRKESLNITGPSAEQLVTEYKHDAAGNRTLVTDPLGIQTHFAYDNLNRVVAEYGNFGQGRPAQPNVSFNSGTFVQPYPGYNGTAEFLEGGSKLTLTGNIFGHAPVNYAADHRTVLEFELKIEQLAGYIGIAFDTNTFIDPGDELRYFELRHGEFQVERLADGFARVHIPIGHFFRDSEEPGLTINYVSFHIYTAPPPGGFEPADRSKVTFRNMRLYQSEETRAVATYDPRGNLISETTTSDPRDIFTRFEYDRLGQLVRQTNDAGGPLEQVFLTGYDLVGNVVIERNDTANTHTIHEYDRLGRVVKTTLPDPDGPQSPAPSPQTLFFYDAAGNLIAETNGEGETTRTAYDARGRAVSAWDGNGDETRYRYDAQGNLATLIDAEQNVTRYKHDGLDRLTEEANTFGTRYSVHDAAGNRYLTVDRNNRVRLFVFDTLDRQVQEQWYSGSAWVTQREWRYDKLGRVTYQRDGGSINTFQFDGLGRLTQATNYDPAAAPGASGLSEVKLTYAYDFQITWDLLAGAVFHQRTIRTEFDHDASDVGIGQTQLRYDELGRRKDLSDFDADVSAGPVVASKQLLFGYNTADDLTLIRHRGNFTGFDWTEFDTDIVYDKAGRVTSITHDLATDIVHAYAYDNASRITSFNTTGTGAATRGYGYDDAGQLTAKTGGTAESYAYDDNGNRTHVGSQSIATGAGNRLTSDGTYSYLYDNEGNLIRRTPLATPSSTNPVTVYGYDHRNRLTSLGSYASVADADNSVNATRVIAYVYDAQGRRVLRALDADGAGAAAVSVEHFVYDGDELALRFGGAGELTHRYLYGPAVDQVLADEVFTAGGGGQRVSDEVLWQIADQQGTVRDLVDDNGTLRKHVDYDSFGRITGHVHFDEDGASPVPLFEQVDQLFYFQGAERDEATGLQYHSGGEHDGRWYDPPTGRWLSEDPVPAPNLYPFVKSGPTYRTDPTGAVQAGNPLNALFGGFSGGSVAPFFPISSSLSAGNNFAAFTAPTFSTSKLAPSIFNVNSSQLVSSLLAPEPSRAATPVGPPRSEPGVVTRVASYVSNTAAAGYGRGLKDSVDRTFESAVKGVVYAWNDPRGAAESVVSGLRETKDTIGEYTVGWFFESQRAKNLGTIGGAADAALARFDQLKDASTYEQARAIGNIVGTIAQIFVGPKLIEAATPAKPWTYIDDIVSGRPNSNPLSRFHADESGGLGSYTNTHQSGKTYSGKGDTTRMNRSAGKISRKHDDPVIDQQHTPAADTKQSFIDEQNRIEANGGPGESTYNKINSPGKKLRDGT